MITRQLSREVIRPQPLERASPPSTLLQSFMVERQRTEGVIGQVKHNVDPMKLSVIIVGKNEQSRIASCLESVIIGLDSQNTEVIYVDNESDDHTLEIARRYPITTIQRQGDRMRSPYAAAYADGVRLSKGFFVQFLDADCLLDPSWPALALGYMTANPDIGILAGRVVEAAPADTLLGRIYISHCEHMSTPGEQKEIDGPAFIVRRECFEKAGPPDSEIGIGGAMELDLGVRIRAAGYRLVRLEIPMAIHRGPCKGPLKRLVSSLRNGYRFARTLVKLLRGYPGNPFLVGLLRENSLKFLMVAVIALWIGITGLTGFLLFCLVYLMSVILISVIKKVGVDIVLFQSLSIMLHSIGFAMGIPPILKKHRRNISRD